MRLRKQLGRWKLRWIDPDTGRERTKCTGLEATEANRPKAQALRAEADRQLRHFTRGNTCGEILTAYRAHVREKASPNARPENADYAAKALTEFFGDLTPEQVTHESTRAFGKHMADKGNLPGTTLTYLKTLRAALRWDDRNTPAKFDMPAEPEPVDRFLTREEATRYVDAALSPHVRLFIQIALGTGGRKEAILGLRWDQHIDFERNTIWLGFKSGGKRRAPHLPMNAELRQALEEAHEVRLSDWVIEYRGEQVRNIRTGLRAAIRRAALTDIGQPAHVMRHTAGVWMAEAGIPMATISQVLGHSSTAITERVYARFSPEGLNAPIQALNIGLVNITKIDGTKGD